MRTATNDAAARLSDMVDVGSTAASKLAAKSTALLQDGAGQLSEAGDYAGRKATQTRSRAIDLFNENPLLVAGAGVAFGALLAAIMPATAVEGQLLDGVAPDLKQKASDLVAKGYEAARATTSDTYDAAVDRAKDHGLSPEGAQSATSDLGGRIGAVVDAAVGQHGTDHSDDGNTHS